MKHGLLFKLWDTLRASYWFVPAVMAVSAVGLALGLTALDHALGEHWVRHAAWLFANQPAGARGLLSAIAGSMITVAGVTFSLTISSVAQTAAQFGPRLLTNFMQDRGNQITLGTFIAAFIYSLLVLRTVHGEGEAGATEIEAFVPHFSVLAAILLALASVAVLIYFVHHVPASIHISNVVARIGRELCARIADEFPGRDQPTATPPPGDLEQRRYSAKPIAAGASGYVQHVDCRGLAALAEEEDALLFSARQPGDFINAAMPVAYVWPAERRDDAWHDRVRAAFTVGDQRTQAQDPLFLARELIEIAARALSPGVNDSFTAIDCINWLAAALAVLAGRRFPSAQYFDDNGTLRLVMPAGDFGAVADQIFGELRPYAQQDRNAALHLLKVIGELAAVVDAPDERAALVRHAKLLHEGCQQSLAHREDREAVARRLAGIITPPALI